MVAYPHLTDEELSELEQLNVPTDPDVATDRHDWSVAYSKFEIGRLIR